MSRSSAGWSHYLLFYFHYTRMLALQQRTLFHSTIEYLLSPGACRLCVTLAPRGRTPRLPIPPASPRTTTP